MKKKFQASKFFAKAKAQATRINKPEFDHVYCIYHDKDLDGVLSAAIVKEQYPDVEFIPFDYGYELDLKFIERGAGVFIVDCCLPDHAMKYLDEFTELYLFDHHYHSYHDPFCKKLKGWRTLNIAACMLVYEFFHPFSAFPDGVKLVAKGDTWDKSDQMEWDLRILPFNYGLRQFPLDPGAKIYQQVIESKKAVINRAIDDGQVIIRYCKVQSNQHYKANSFETVINIDGEAVPVLAINDPLVDFEFFIKYVNKKKVKAMIGFARKKGGYKYSVRSWPGGTDAGKIAGHFGGGGRKHTAGFWTDQDIFK